MCQKHPRTLTPAPERPPIGGPLPASGDPPQSTRMGSSPQVRHAVSAPRASGPAIKGNNDRVTAEALPKSQIHSLTRPNMVSVGTIVWLSSELMFFAALFAM